jgi:tRNA(Ile)-lysidine synthase
MGPQPAVAQVRAAVRSCLRELAEGEMALAACSGGADSLALAAALAHEAPRLRIRAGGVTVDHGLAAGSAERAGATAALLAGLGLDPVENIAVTVAGAPGHGGTEAAARDARYAAFATAVQRTGAAVVLLAHSRDDQAETVLLGLARGSGARSLAGMPASRGPYRRPLLGLPRATLHAACAALALPAWEDPHNLDPCYLRSRARYQALPALETALGPGIAEALARSASQLRADADLLDELAETRAPQVLDSEGHWQAAPIAAQPAAIRARLLRRAALAAGCPAGALTAGHIAALDALVTAWRGQRWADLPGGVRARRHCGKLLFTSPGRGCPDAAEAEAGVGRQ